MACNHCFDACLKEDDVKMMAECIRLDRECAEVCAVLEQAAARNSPFVPQLAQVCAEECRKHDDQHCQDCAEACSKCAEVCRKVA
jgi:hypothetical protein